MSKCSICRLTDYRRAAVDAALRDGRASLQEISESSGLTRSSLHRHRQHLSDAGEISQVRIPEAITDKPRIKSQIEARAQTPAVVTAVEPIPPQASTKAELLSRLEFLWQESLDGIQATKEPIQIRKADGSTVEVSADLRSRPAFLREARAVLELQASANGHLSVGPAAAITIVLPNASQSQEPDPKCIIDIAMPRRQQP